MLSCKDVADRASALIDGNLSVWDRLQIRLHLAMCKGCSRFIAQVRRTDQLTAEVAELETSPRRSTRDGRKDALLSVLRKEQPRR